VGSKIERATSREARQVEISAVNDGGGRALLKKERLSKSCS
jgi:hypothetical protein